MEVQNVRLKNNIMISNKELKKLQKLAKVDFSDSELEDFSHKLASVVGMIDKLQEIDCEGVEPLRSVCDMHQRMREDKIETSDISEDLFKNIPDKGAEIAKEVKCFVVPKVIE
jgi:aspartyl-tRNA(Asn)/glutamyl-tRNA(Gln) amidotransferase subunit C